MHVECAPNVIFSTSVQKRIETIAKKRREMIDLIRRLKGLFTRSKKRDLREICLEMYGEEYVEKYDTLNSGAQLEALKKQLNFWKNSAK